MLELSEQPFYQNLTHQHLNKLVSLTMSELRKSPLKKLLSSREQPMIASFQLSSWEEAPETFSKISKGPLTMESTFTDQWLKNRLLSRVQEVSKLCYPTNLKFRLRNLPVLTNTVIADLPKHSRFSPEYCQKMRV